MVKVAHNLTFLMGAICEDEYDVSDTIKKLMETGKEFKSVLNDLEEETERELSEPWSKPDLVVLSFWRINRRKHVKRRGTWWKAKRPRLVFHRS